MAARRASVTPLAAAALIEPAFAKINLTLRVIGRRADGYHNLESLVCFATLSDRVELRVGAPFELRCLRRLGKGFARAEERGDVHAVVDGFLNRGHDYCLIVSLRWTALKQDNLPKRHAINHRPRTVASRAGCRYQGTPIQA